MPTNKEQLRSTVEIVAEQKRIKARHNKEKGHDRKTEIGFAVAGGVAAALAGTIWALSNPESASHAQEMGNFASQALAIGGGVSEVFAAGHAIVKGITRKNEIKPLQEEYSNAANRERSENNRLECDYERWKAGDLEHQQKPIKQLPQPQPQPQQNASAPVPRVLSEQEMTLAIAAQKAGRKI